MAEVKQVLVPDIGDFKNIPIVELLVKPGDEIKKEDALLSLESDKATIEIPSPFAGIVKEINVREGDRVSEGTTILEIEINQTDSLVRVSSPSKQVSSHDAIEVNINSDQAIIAGSETNSAALMQSSETISIMAHASPSVRRFARELGVNLNLVSGCGKKNRILKDDVKAYVKAEISKSPSNSNLGLNLLPWPKIDFSTFGPIESKSLLRVQRISGEYLHRNWVMIPHVTQFDEADITEIEAGRKKFNKLKQKSRVKLTILAYLMEAVVAALKEFPDFNSSLEGERDNINLIIKKYYHIGFAVDTPHGLMVPVIRDADQKNIVIIAEEMGYLAERARLGKLKFDEMQGGSFTISSLGGIGGTAFTPIINAPEVAILGASRANIKPVYCDDQFVPRLMLPLSLSYDHRVIDGASAARFTKYIIKELANMSQVLI
ncbi:MAG: branched-chain alpha-keto acid dehydrogenase subunit E2 [Nitrosomonadaceae bacterium]|nr:branched-chain alpha-keto acid dehydrogenase subunit E2 [Nitrosomonadaceae bacterium]